ncbi:MAG: kynurenine formamidase [Isosphaeraceae bacterium]|jgi:arylformamidase|nr:MAG: kynurenine formamidase [Isosphaeraceae bacterium]
MTDLIDISPTLDSATWVWPGDTPLERRVLLDRARGDSLTLSTLTATVHLGAHADAWSHVAAGGCSIEAHALDPYVGPCQVIAVETVAGRRITPEQLPRQIEHPRILFRTGTFDGSTDFAALCPETVHALADRGVTLVGIDTPSIDPFDSKTLDAHHACVERRVMILEGLMLRDVPTGCYELIALPLRLVGFDASPVRAVLRPLSRPTP